MIDYGHIRLREDFLSFFENREHSRVSSSSLIPRGDRTLLFTNAGMNQFKDFFLDIKPSPYKRAVSCQKCLRAGGKHNDLDNVGYTPRHHTFFEMLGNFSFGDYFKEKAVELAWDFIINTLGIPSEKLFVSVYERDEEAYCLWNQKIGLESCRIFSFGDKQNFWAMGDTGPCGPCSEIFYDLGDSYGQACQENEERFLEIWNLVFMQFDRNKEGILTPLKNKNIDTGMGLERTLSVIESRESNFDSSIFIPMIKRCEEIFEKKYSSDDSLECTAFRVIADHSRAIAMLIADGQVPTNFSRGYVLRRIIRRAYRYGIVLGASGPFLCKVIEAFTGEMSGVYPELIEKHRIITEIVQREEESFKITLARGVERVNDLIAELKAKDISVIEGKDAFRLYDTYGIPLDIIIDIARDSKISFDEKDFIASMEEQRTKARSSSQFKADGAGFRMLEEQGLKTEFTGYDLGTSCKAKVEAILCENRLVGEAGAGEAFIITGKTPFYAEKGGQVGDKGIIINLDTGEEYKVTDTVLLAESVTGHKTFLSAKLRVGDRIILELDAENRKNIERNHTATHLLHYALREVLGESARQAGSLVDSERLRFDFAYHKQLTQEQINRVEYLVQDAVLRCFDVIKEEMDYNSAIDNGAIALFTEKYEDVVRVIRIGDFSIELCGGTHISNTGEIGMFKITQESAIASGIRRIEAITGFHLFKRVQDLFLTEKILKTQFIKGDSGITEYVRDMNERLKSMDKEMESLKLKLLNSEISQIIKNAVSINGISLIRYKTEEKEPRILKILMDNIKQRTSMAVIIIVSCSGTPFVLCGITKDLKNDYNANEILKALLDTVDGKGGGRPDLAQGGFRDSRNAVSLYNRVENIIRGIIK